MTSLATATSGFLAWLAPRKLSGATTSAYKQDIEVIARLLAADKFGVDDVNVRNAAEFTSRLTVGDLDRTALRAAFARYSADHAKASIQRAHATWRQFFEFLVADGLVDGSPMAAIARPRADEKAPKPLEGWAEDTVATLLSSLASGARGGRDPWPELDVALVATLLATGVRRSELLAMDIGSLEGDRGSQMIRVIGKGAKPRTIPVESGLDEILGKYLESRKARFPGWHPKSNDPLFVTTAKPGDAVRKFGGTRLNARQLHYVLEKSLSAAGLGGRRPNGAMAHAFRHTYGTTLAADGAPVAAIRKLMGHSSINTSQGYIDSLAREERSVAARNRVYDVLEKLSDDETVVDLNELDENRKD